MAWEIILLEPVEAWLVEVCESDSVTAERTQSTLDRLSKCGPSLGRPLVDTVHRSKLSNLKELRPVTSGQTQIRMLFVFDRERRAIFLVAGNKVGRWERWYRDSIKLAEKRYSEYLAERDDEGNR